MRFQKLYIKQYFTVKLHKMSNSILQSNYILQQNYSRTFVITKVFATNRESKRGDLTLNEQSHWPDANL